MAKKKIKVVVGEPIQETLASDDGFRILIAKGTVVTKEMVARLANWIYEEPPQLPVERKKVLPKKNNRDLILKKLEFDEIVSKQTRKDLEDGAGDFFKKIQKQDMKLDIESLQESIFKMVDGMSDNTDVPLRMFDFEKKATHVFTHSTECGIIASFIATALNYPPQTVAAFSLSMTMHDIGLLTLPQAIIGVKEGLSPEQAALIREHPRRGWDILKRVKGIEPLTQMVVLGHHIRADGTGYPDNIDFSDLPPLVHLAAIINNYEAMISWRSDRRAYSMHDAIKLLLVQRARYHPGALESFIKVVGIFPISTFVRLNTGEIGAVVRNNPENLFLPEIKLVMNPAGRPYAKEIIVNLLNETDRQIIKVEEHI